MFLFTSISIQSIHLIPIARQEFVQQASPGPAHLAVSLQHNRAVVANYGAKSVTVISLVEGGR